MKACSSDDDRGTIDGGQGWSKELRAKVAACPREPEHSYGPSGYLAWHTWADKRRRTHRQSVCDCGLYLLIEPKKAAVLREAPDA